MPVGYMIALRIPERLGARTAELLDGNARPAPADDLHVTLLVGQDQDRATIDAVMTAAERVARRTPAVPVDFTHGDTMGPKDERVVTLLPGDPAPVATLRARLAEALDQAGVAWSDKWSYRPHMTISEPVNRDRAPWTLEGRGIPFTATAVGVWHNGRLVTEFPLDGGGQIGKSMPLVSWLEARGLTPLAKHLGDQHDQLHHGRRRGANGEMQPGRGETRRAQIERGRKEYQAALARITPERKAKGEARIAAMNERAEARRKKPAGKTDDPHAELGSALGDGWAKGRTDNASGQLQRDGKTVGMVSHDRARGQWVATSVDGKGAPQFSGHASAQEAVDAVHGRLGDKKPAASATVPESAAPAKQASDGGKFSRPGWQRSTEHDGGETAGGVGQGSVKPRQDGKWTGAAKIHGGASSRKTFSSRDEAAAWVDEQLAPNVKPGDKRWPSLDAQIAAKHDEIRRMEGGMGVPHPVFNREGRQRWEAARSELEQLKGGAQQQVTPPKLSGDQPPAKLGGDRGIGAAREKLARARQALDDHEPRTPAEQQLRYGIRQVAGAMEGWKPKDRGAGYELHYGDGKVVTINAGTRAGGAGRSQFTVIGPDGTKIANPPTAQGAARAAMRAAGVDARDIAQVDLKRQRETDRNAGVNLAEQARQRVEASKPKPMSDEEAAALDRTYEVQRMTPEQRRQRMAEARSAALDAAGPISRGEWRSLPRQDREKASLKDPVTGDRVVRVRGDDGKWNMHRLGDDAKPAAEKAPAEPTDPKEAVKQATAGEGWSRMPTGKGAMLSRGDENIGFIGHDESGNRWSAVVSGGDRPQVSYHATAAEAAKHLEAARDSAGSSTAAAEGEGMSEAARRFLERRDNRLQRKAERYGGYAGNARARSDAAYNRAKQTADMIPMGQPMLVDHYSYKGDRNRRARMQQNFSRSYEESQKADRYEGKVKAIEAAQRTHQVDRGFAERRIKEATAELARLDRAGVGDTPYRQKQQAKLEAYQHELKRHQSEGRQGWAKNDFQPGDVIMHRGRVIGEVARSNPKSVSLKTEYSWNSTLSHDKIPSGAEIHRKGADGKYAPAERGTADAKAKAAKRPTKSARDALEGTRGSWKAFGIDDKISVDEFVNHPKAPSALVIGLGREIGVRGWGKMDHQQRLAELQRRLKEG